MDVPSPIPVFRCDSALDRAAEMFKPGHLHPGDLARMTPVMRKIEMGFGDQSVMRAAQKRVVSMPQDLAQVAATNDKPLRSRVNSPIDKTLPELPPSPNHGTNQLIRENLAAFNTPKKKVQRSDSVTSAAVQLSKFIDQRDFTKTPKPVNLSIAAASVVTKRGRPAHTHLATGAVANTAINLNQRPPTIEEEPAPMPLFQKRTVPQSKGYPQNKYRSMVGPVVDPTQMHPKHHHHLFPSKPFSNADRDSIDEDPGWREPSDSPLPDPITLVPVDNNYPERSDVPELNMTPAYDPRQVQDQYYPDTYLYPPSIQESYDASLRGHFNPSVTNESIRSASVLGGYQPSLNSYVNYYQYYDGYQDSYQDSMASPVNRRHHYTAPQQLNVMQEEDSDSLFSNPVSEETVKGETYQPDFQESFRPPLGPPPEVGSDMDSFKKGFGNEVIHEHEQVSFGQVPHAYHVPDVGHLPHADHASEEAIIQEQMHEMQPTMHEQVRLPVEQFARYENPPTLPQPTRSPPQPYFPSKQLAEAGYLATTYHKPTQIAADDYQPVPQPRHEPEPQQPLPLEYLQEYQMQEAPVREVKYSFKPPHEYDNTSHGYALDNDNDYVEYDRYPTNSKPRVAQYVCDNKPKASLDPKRESVEAFLKRNNMDTLENILDKYMNMCENSVMSSATPVPQPSVQPLAQQHIPQPDRPPTADHVITVRVPVHNTQTAGVTSVSRTPSKVKQQVRFDPNPPPVHYPPVHSETSSEYSQESTPQVREVIVEKTKVVVMQNKKEHHLPVPPHQDTPRSYDTYYKANKEAALPSIPDPTRSPPVPEKVRSSVTAPKAPAVPEEHPTAIRAAQRKSLFAKLRSGTRRPVSAYYESSDAIKKRVVSWGGEKGASSWGNERSTSWGGEKNPTEMKKSPSTGGIVGAIRKLGPEKPMVINAIHHSHERPVVPEPTRTPPPPPPKSLDPISTRRVPGPAEISAALTANTFDDDVSLLLSRTQALRLNT